MATAPAQAQLTFYPAYCHSASPTYFAWVKLTAHDIYHALRPRHGFSDITPYNQRPAGPGLLLFYGNHPVQFVQVVGVIVAMEEYLEKCWLFTVDDSSGATVEVTCRKPAQRPPRDGAEVTAENEIEEDDPRGKTVQQLDCGVVVQVKGTIGTFRGVRQIQLERIVVVRDTNAEVRLIQARTRMLTDVLSKPWVLSPGTQKRLQQEALGETDMDLKRVKKATERRARKLTREKKHAEEIAREYEKEEAQREVLAEQARVAGRLLLGEVTA